MSSVVVGVRCTICEHSFEGMVSADESEAACKKACRTSELTADVPFKLKYLVYVAGMLKMPCLPVCSVGVASC